MSRLSEFVSPLRQDARHAFSGSSVRWISGYILGTLTPMLVSPALAPVAFWLAVAALLFSIVVRLAQRRRSGPLSPFEQTLLNPSPAALARVAAENKDYLVVDSAVEIWPCPNLSTRTALYEQGWNTEHVAVEFNHAPFDASGILEASGGLSEFDPPNGRKFSLQDHSLLGTDTALGLTVAETNYFAIRSVLRELPFNRRTEFGSLDPRRNRIPHSLCLHYIVRLDDATVLCSLNESRKAYGPKTWSFSGEEQLKLGDLQSLYPLRTLFRRALLEEVFGLNNDEIPVDERWSAIAEHVRCARIWSLFVEEHINNFSLLGFSQLNLSRSAMGNLLEAHSGRGAGLRDAEGCLYTMKGDSLLDLLVLGSAEAVGLRSGRTRPAEVDALHWTSRYRVFRLLRALKGTSLAPRPSMTGG